MIGNEIKLIIVIFLAVTIISCSSPKEPEWLWIKTINDTYHVYIMDITADDMGNSYVIGNFTNTARFGYHSLVSKGYEDVFVGKLDTAGKWLWLEHAGGNSRDFGYNIAQDCYGDIYITGNFQDIARFGSYSINTSAKNSNSIMAKISSSGKWLWAKSICGQQIIDITTDNIGNIYVSGNFSKTLHGFGNHTLKSLGYSDIFLAKYNSTGICLWVKNLGGENKEKVTGIAVDNTSNTYLTGHFEGDTTFGSYAFKCAGKKDLFIAKIDFNGNYLWVKNLGYQYDDVGTDIVVDKQNNVYLTGYFTEAVKFQIGGIFSKEILIAKISNTGEWLWQDRRTKGFPDSQIHLGIDSNENIYLSGSFQGGLKFKGLHSISSPPVYAKSEIFIAKMNSKRKWDWATKIGASNFDVGKNVAIDPAGNVYFIGEFAGDVNFGSNPVTAVGAQDAFVAKIKTSIK